MYEHDLLTRLLIEPDQPFAMLYRPGRDAETIEIFRLENSKAYSIEEAVEGGVENQDRFVVLPFSQVKEKGFDARDEGLPIHALQILERAKIPRFNALLRLHDDRICATNKHFNLDDDAFGARVRRIIEDEIGHGAGSNFVMHRKMMFEIEAFGPMHRLALFRRLLEMEAQAYWVFVIYTGEQTFLGLSPELHASLEGGEVTMNPISGTYSYPEGGPERDTLLAFLENPKEASELFMVVDEELKMLSQLCEDGARAEGPQLKFLDHLAHTEYLLRGRTKASVTEVLRQTTHAPTVTGSPVQSACEVIARYEPEGRRYYAGVVGLIEHGPSGTRLDSTIAIRTLEIDQHGHCILGVGATIVRDSTVEGEAEETRVKTRTLMSAFDTPKKECLENTFEVTEALRARGKRASSFWSDKPKRRTRKDHAMWGQSVVILDGRDDFTAMIATMTRAVGAEARVLRHWTHDDLENADLVVCGPGPGSPLDMADPRTTALRDAMSDLLEHKRPFLSICLSHQILSGLLGLRVRRLDLPNQGAQKTLEMLGRREIVGFYNSFCASAEPLQRAQLKMRGIEVITEPGSADVFCITGRGFASVQFHLESFLTHDGLGLLDRLTAPLLGSVNPTRLRA